jgi:hypothetical protein
MQQKSFLKLIMLMKFFQTQRKEENMINLVKKVFKKVMVDMVMILVIFFLVSLEEAIRDQKKDKKDPI